MCLSKIKYASIETHLKHVNFDVIVPETGQMQDDILPAKQVLKASLPPSPADHLSGWWGDGRRDMEAAKPPSSGSLAAGLPRASWPAIEAWECAGESKWTAREVSGISYFSPAGETQSPIFIHFCSLLEANLIEACFLG